MMRIAIAYLATFVTFVALDAVWLSLVAIGQFQRALGTMLLAQPNLYAAAIFYVIFTGGLIFLAVRPALERRSLATTISHGAVVGLTSYATFDLTNLAILRGWTLELALLDMAWGTALSAIAATAGYLAGVRMART